jgi:hypothetical protein
MMAVLSEEVTQARDIRQRLAEGCPGERLNVKTTVLTVRFPVVSHVSSSEPIASRARGGVYHCVYRPAVAAALSKKKPKSDYKNNSTPHSIYAGYPSILPD